MPTKNEMRAELTAADAIARKAASEGRDMTPAEVSQVSEHIESYTTMKAAYDRGDVGVTQKQLDDAAAVKAMLDGLANGPTPAVSQGGFKTRAATEWAKAAQTAIRTATREVDGEKALISGSVGTPSIVGDPSLIPAVPRTVLDLIRGRDIPATGDGNGVSYVQQLTRPTGAQAVADGALKPTGTATFRQVDDRLRVIAILSEALPLRLLTDFNGLTDILRVQLGEAVLAEIERLVLNGSGSGEEFTGLLNVSGIQTQAQSATVSGVDTRIETSRFAASKVRDIGGTAPTGFVLNPLDWDAIALARLAKNPQNEAREGAGELLHGIPVVTNPGLARGTGLVGDWETLELALRDRDRLDIDTAGDLFTRNQFRARAETRATLKIGRPNAFCRFSMPIPA